MEEITKEDGTAFGSKGSLAMVLKQKGLTDTYETVETTEGFVGVPKRVKDKLIKCRVYRSNVDPDNRDMHISVTHNSLAHKKIFWPGEEVELTEGQINILKDSVEENRLFIPAESGIYASKDPIAVAKNFYPNMRAEVNPTDNTISMISRVPNFIVELVE